MEDPSYIADPNDSTDFHIIQLDSSGFDLGSPPFPHTPSYNGSYHNSPYSNHSELSFTAEDNNSFGIFDNDQQAQQAEYDPSEYDPPQSSLLMFNDGTNNNEGYMLSSAPLNPGAGQRDHGSYDYSSPSSNGGGDSGEEGKRRSRASSVSSNPNARQAQASPRMNVAQAFDNMTFRSPNWGTEPLPQAPRSASPHHREFAKAQSPPRLLMPDAAGDGNNAGGLAPPTINAPEGDGLGPRLHIVPATPVSGGGAAGPQAVPFQTSLETLHQGASTQPQWKPPQQEELYRPDGTYDFSSAADPSAAHRGHQRTGSNASNHSAHSANNSPYLFPSTMLPGVGGTMGRPRSASDHALEPNSFIGQMGNIGSALDDSMGDAPLSVPQQQQRRFDAAQGSPHRSSFGSHTTLNNTFSFGGGGAPGGFGPPPGSAGLDNGFLSPDMGVGLRRSKSDASRPGHVRQSRSEDIRGSTLFPPGSLGGGDEFRQHSSHQQQFLSPVDPPPSIRAQGLGGGRHYRSVSTGGGSARSERGSFGGGAGTWSAASSNRASPYPSPNVSPSPHYSELPPEEYRGGGGGPDAPIIVSKQNVTTVRTSKASHNRRKQEATFVCPVPGCGSTFTRSFNLKGHIRSHNEEKPFLCKWPGCGKGFARQHDCKRHEQLHTNYRPFCCEGCGKQFARMDALNRHLRSEGGAECQRTLEANGRMPDFSGAGLMPDAGGSGQGGGRARSYSTGSYPGSPDPPPAPALRMGGPKTEDPWANMGGVQL